MVYSKPTSALARAKKEEAIREIIDAGPMLDVSQMMQHKQAMTSSLQKAAGSSTRVSIQLDNIIRDAFVALFCDRSQPELEITFGETDIRVTQKWDDVDTLPFKKGWAKAMATKRGPMNVIARNPSNHAIAMRQERKLRASGRQALRATLKDLEDEFAGMVRRSSQDPKVIEDLGLVRASIHLQGKITNLKRRLVSDRKKLRDPVCIKTVYRWNDQTLTLIFDRELMEIASTPVPAEELLDPSEIDWTMLDVPASDLTAEEVIDLTEEEPPKRQRLDGVERPFLDLIEESEEAERQMLLSYEKNVIELE